MRPCLTRIPARIAKPAKATHSERSPHSGFVDMSKMIRKSSIRSARVRAISRCILRWKTERSDLGLAELAQSAGPGPKKSAPARKVVAKRMIPITIQSSPKPQKSLSTTSQMPLTTARSEWMKTRVLIHSTS